jgi:hypothetical protein
VATKDQNKRFAFSQTKKDNTIEMQLEDTSEFRSRLQRAEKQQSSFGRYGKNVDNINESKRQTLKYKTRLWPFMLKHNWRETILEQSFFILFYLSVSVYIFLIFS